MISSNFVSTPLEPIFVTLGAKSTPLWMNGMHYSDGEKKKN